CLIWTGHKDSDGYGLIRVNGSDMGTHRYAWERVNGRIPEKMMIDHADCYEPSCVNVAHLRLATRLQNSSNRAGANADNKNSKIRNVYKSGNRWMVRIRKNGTSHYLGTYAS